MKISEAIEKLNKFKAECGDLELVTVTDVDGRFCVEWGRDLDVIELSNDDETDFDVPVVAFLEPDCDHDNDGRPPLKLIPNPAS